MERFAFGLSGNGSKTTIFPLVPKIQLFTSGCLKKSTRLSSYWEGAFDSKVFILSLWHRYDRNFNFATLDVILSGLYSQSNSPKQAKFPKQPETDGH